MLQKEDLDGKQEIKRIVSNKNIRESNESA